MPHIAVIGAGITGITTAYALSKQGYEVTVFERHPYAAMETSFANGGQLSACNAEVWNHWSTLLHGVFWMFKQDAPLLLNPAPNWHKYSWIAEFIAQLRHYRANTIDTTRLAIAARSCLFGIAEEEGIAFDQATRGILQFYEQRNGFERARKVNALLVEAGLDRRSVSLVEMRGIEPALCGEYYGGFFTPSDFTGDVHKFSRALAEVCARRGVRFLYEAAVERIASSPRDVTIGWQPAGSNDGRKKPSDVISVDGVVVCAGIDSRRIAAALGDRLNVYPVKGYSITVYLDNDQSKEAAPHVGLLDDAAKIVTSRLGPDRLRIAGTAEFNGVNRDIRADRIRPLLDWCRRRFPAVHTDRVVPWSGLRPMMPSMMPRVGRGKRERVFYNTGHGHLGWTLSAATAQLITQTIANELPPDSFPPKAGLAA
jgi:D-amino-acid dehydrogenase